MYMYHIYIYDVHIIHHLLKNNMLIKFQIFKNMQDIIGAFCEI